jgi:hypothetical protein
LQLRQDQQHLQRRWWSWGRHRQFKPPALAAGSALAPVVFTTQPTTDRDHDADEGAQLRYHKLEDLIGNVGVPVVARADQGRFHQYGGAIGGHLH